MSSSSADELAELAFEGLPDYLFEWLIENVHTIRMKNYTGFAYKTRKPYLIVMTSLDLYDDNQITFLHEFSHCWLGHTQKRSPNVEEEAGTQVYDWLYEAGRHELAEKAWRDVDFGRCRDQPPVGYVVF